jgi:hypothetical protein
MNNKIFFLTIPAVSGFSEPMNAGVDAQMILYPADAKPGNEMLSVTFVNFDKTAQDAMQMNDSELVEYVKSTFLATSKPAEAEIERNILGQKAKGQKLTKKIPVPSGVEVYLIPGPDDCKLSIGVVTSQPGTDESEKIISELFQSLKV